MTEPKKPGDESLFPTEKPTTAVAKSTPETPEAEPKQPKLEADLLALAKTPDERLTAYQLASSVRKNQMVAAAAKELAANGWGQGISAYGRAAVIRYCLEIGADPMRHVFILGGSIYLNAEFYRELVASNPYFIRDTVQFIHDDTRATDGERALRRALRVEHGVPENAPGAALVTLYYRGGRGPFVGVNWAGARDKDPVGKAEPTKSAHTRAYRKAALKAEPAWFKQHPGLAAAEEVIAQGRVISEANVATLPSGQPTEQDVIDRARRERETA